MRATSAAANPSAWPPGGFASYCKEHFGEGPVACEVVDDVPLLQQEYPLMMAVGRASLAVERHHPCVIRLHYRGAGEVNRSYLFAGKGVSYDTGGADLKVGGHMAGMSRDKGGAAALTGLMETLAQLGPEGIEVWAELGMVRNSIGADSFVADEIIRSHVSSRKGCGRHTMVILYEMRSYS